MHEARLAHPSSHTTAHPNQNAQPAEAPPPNCKPSTPQQPNPRNRTPTTPPQSTNTHTHTQAAQTIVPRLQRCSQRRCPNQQQRRALVEGSNTQKYRHQAAQNTSSAQTASPRAHTQPPRKSASAITWPASFRPQHETAPLLRTAQECSCKPCMRPASRTPHHTPQPTPTTTRNQPRRPPQLQTKYSTAAQPSQPHTHYPKAPTHTHKLHKQSYPA